MEGKRLLRSLTMRNLLSFGPEGITLEFEPLNVLIGPNGSGKSNLIDVLGLLGALPLPESLSTYLSGGTSEWVWKGLPIDSYSSIETEWDYEINPPLKFSIGLRFEQLPVLVTGEKIWQDSDGIPAGFKEHYRTPNAMGDGIYAGVSTEDLPKVRATLRADESILARRRDREAYPELAYLGDRLKAIRFYRDWIFGRSAPARQPHHAIEPDQYLNEGMENLAQVLKRFRKDPVAWADVIETMKNVYDGIKDVKIIEMGDFVYFALEEENDVLIYANHLSDGTIRFLCLLAILSDPTPPPLVCIEEPELGLPPDLISTIARLLIDASRRTQLIVTTHSVDLVTALWEFPESVVVCDRGFVGSRMQRLDPIRLKKWLDRYSLGELWMSGEIGGTRW